MISDTLSEAIAEIQNYLDDLVFEQVYDGDLRQQIEATVAVMEATRVRLDTPPPVPKTPVFTEGVFLINGRQMTLSEIEAMDKRVYDQSWKTGIQGQSDD